MNFSCPASLRDHPHVILGHGGGGALSRDLIEGIFLPAFSNPLLDRLGDSAVLDMADDLAGGGRLAISTGVGFSDLYQWNWSPAVTWINVMAGDFDGDGRTDIAGRDAFTGGWRVSRISGTTAVSSSFGTWGASIPYAFFMVGDFNGDGRADITGRNRNTGTWRVGLGSATAFTDTAYWNWTTLKTWSWAAAVRT
jgi:hypothetical protein